MFVHGTCSPLTSYLWYRSRDVEFVSVSVDAPSDRAAVTRFLNEHHSAIRNLQVDTEDVYAVQKAVDPKWQSGVPYTIVSASSDGWISFGTATSSALTNNLATGTTAPRPVLAPLWDDLGGASAGQASYQTSGTAGSRVFTFQWLNWEWNYLANAAVISFQVKLYEADGHIEFVYRQDAAAVKYHFPR